MREWSLTGQERTSLAFLMYVDVGARSGVDVRRVVGGGMPRGRAGGCA